MQSAELYSHPLRVFDLKAGLGGPPVLQTAALQLVLDPILLCISIHNGVGDVVAEGINRRCQCDIYQPASDIAPTIAELWATGVMWSRAIAGGSGKAGTKPWYSAEGTDTKSSSVVISAMSRSFLRDLTFAPARRADAALDKRRIAGRKWPASDARRSKWVARSP
jgi:hypothetical protein